MKRFLLVLVLLMFAGSVFAAELKVNGDMNVRGSTYNNLALAENNEAMVSMFDYDLTINAALIANEKATIFTRLTFDKDVKGTGYVADGTAGAGDVGLAVERAYINYKFAPYLQLNTGLMGGGQWASAFGNTEVNVMRVQAIGALSKDMIFIATYEKRFDQGAFNPSKDDEDGDTTFYYLASIMKFNQISVLPLLVFGQQGINYNGEIPVFGPALGKYDGIIMAAQLGLNGDFGMFGFESEFHFTTIDKDGLYDDAYAVNPAAPFSMKDSTTYGAYINVFAKVDALKAGLIFAYGSADAKDGSFNFGDDFDLFLVMDDFISNTAAAGLTGFTAFKLYADYKLNDFTFMGALGYGYSNMKDDDATFMEFDLGASYAFDANTEYSVAFGYAMTEDFKAYDADAWRLYHKFAVKF